MLLAIMDIRYVAVVSLLQTVPSREDKDCGNLDTINSELDSVGEPGPAEIEAEAWRLAVVALARARRQLRFEDEGGIESALESMERVSIFSRAMLEEDGRMGPWAGVSTREGV